MSNVLEEKDIGETRINMCCRRCGYWFSYDIETKEKDGYLVVTYKVPPCARCIEEEANEGVYKKLKSLLTQVPISPDERETNE